MLTGNLGNAWHQNGAVRASQASSRWKVEIVDPGEYTISLRRFPGESGLAINAEFPASEKPIELDRSMPESRNAGFTKAFLYIADVKETIK